MQVGRFVRGYVLRHAPFFALGVVALLATNYLTIVLPRLLQEGIDALGTAEAARVVERSVLGMLGASVAIVLVRTLSRICFFNPGRWVEYRLRVDLLARLLRQPPRFHDHWTLGELMSRSTNDLQDIRAFTGFAALQAVNVVIAIPMAIWGMSQLHGWVTVACGVPLALAVLIMRQSVQWMRHHFRSSMEELATLSARILGAYSGVSVIHSYRAAGQIMRAFDQDNEVYIRRMLRISTIRSFLLPAVTVAGNLCILIVLWYGGSEVMAGRMTVGDVAAFTGYVAILVTALGGSGWLLNVLQRGTIALDRVFEILDAPIEQPRPTATLPEAGARGREIEVRHLTFGYDAERGPVLRDVGFRLRAGQTLGIFGPSGSGKTTLLRLLCREYEPPPGSILFDGVDIATVDVDALRADLALVPQNPFLFSISLAENVAFAQPEGEVDRERIQAALDAAQLSDDTRALPDGLGTVVGERGVLLSGGQRQRAALARALFQRGFRLLLLDDILSAVDGRTERAIIAALREVAGGVTRIIVSHRLSALREADQILVLAGGAVLDRGTHEELTARPGLYAEAWKREMRDGAEGASGPPESTR